MIVDKVAKVHPEDELQRKPTRDTDQFSQGSSCNKDPQARHEQTSNHMLANATEHALEEATYCRICLEGRQDGNNLLQACRCRDPIHQNCLLQWVQHRINDDVRNLKCEVCKQPYSVIFQSYICFTCEIAKQKYSKFRKEFAQALVGFLLILALCLAVIILLYKMQIGSEFSLALEQFLSLPHNTIIAIMIIMIIFLGALVVGLAYRLTIHYCYGVRWRIIGNAV